MHELPVYRDKIITFFLIKKTKQYLFSSDVRFIYNFANEKTPSLKIKHHLYIIIIKFIHYYYKT